ncbi:MAG: D-2-hydroxyacid dehydrogenase [Anaerolineales bacterium]|nr:D-2-hydroxyacid dehydrogenase [Anaerolineales bacterium]
MNKLLILSNSAKEYHALIKKANLPNLTIETTPTPETNIVLGETGLIKPAFASLPALAWVQTTTAGVDLLMDSTLRRDYTLTNARNVFGQLMSEYVFGYLLAHEKRILARHAHQQAKRWDGSVPGVLYGKALGLLGVGSIGAEVARMAKAFNLRVHGYTKSSEDSPHVDQYFHGDTLPQFAAGLDYLVSILPKTHATDKIINADLLSQLPPHALLINVGRGNAVDEAALLEALNQNKLAGAVLDVFEQEPLSPIHPFWTAPNLLMTFHTSAMSFPESITRVFVENYQRFNTGQPLKYQVDFERGY